MPMASAVIPTYNRDEYIEGAIETVFAQTYDDIEVVIVDDGSTDDTHEVLDQYTGDDRVRVLHNETNRGIAVSRNRGIEAADGKYVCILDDDDRWHPEKIAKQVALLEERGESYAAVYSGGTIREDDRITQVFAPERRGDVYPEILGGFGMNPFSSHVIRKSALVEVGGFDPAFESGIDWDVSIRLAKAYNYDYVPDLLVERIVHDDNISDLAVRPEHADICGQILEKYGEEIERYPAVERALYANWDEVRGLAAARQGDGKAAYRYYWSAFRREPTPFRAVLVGTAALGPSVFDAIGTVRRTILDARLRRSSSYEGPF